MARKQTQRDPHRASRQGRKDELRPLSPKTRGDGAREQHSDCEKSRDPEQKERLLEGLRDRQNLRRAMEEGFQLLRWRQRSLPWDTGAELPTCRRKPEEISGAGRESGEGQPPAEGASRIPEPLETRASAEDGRDDYAGDVGVDEEGQQRPHRRECAGTRVAPPQAEDEEQTETREKRRERVRSDFRRHVDQERVVD